MASNLFFHGGVLAAVDAKGRVSLPSAFRKLMERRSRQAFPGDDPEKSVIVGELPNHTCLRAFDQSYSRKLYAAIEAQVARRGLDPIEELEAVAEATLPVFGGTEEVSYDTAGRMVLPPPLRQAAGIGELAWFVGKGDTIEIWDPARFREERADQAALLRSLDFALAERAK